MNAKDDSVDAGADATTADDDEGELGERNVGGPHVSDPARDATTADDDEGELGERNVGGPH